MSSFGLKVVAGKRCSRATSASTPCGERIGFAEMTNHSWLIADRSLQFSDWGTGDRVIVNLAISRSN
jgi:hypothetical protein